MSILRKRGKPKLRFRNMSRRVTNKEFNYLKKLCLECLRENENIEKSLDSYYKRIQIFFFYDVKENNIDNSIRDFLNTPDLPIPKSPTPATTVNWQIHCCTQIIIYINSYYITISCIISSSIYPID